MEQLLHSAVRLFCAVDNVELEALYEQYCALSTVEEMGGGITKETFENCLGPLGVEKNLVTERIFQFFDKVW
jgi:hypothetical protein